LQEAHVHDEKFSDDKVSSFTGLRLVELYKKQEIIVTLRKGTIEEYLEQGREIVHCQTVVNHEICWRYPEMRSKYFEIVRVRPVYPSPIK
jgi:hypothetical protein